MAAATHRLETADGMVVADHCAVAGSFLSRFRGLMGRRELPAGEALCLQDCGSIHMFFMRFPIDVAFVNADGRILHACHSIRPWRISRHVFGSKAALELPAGTLHRLGLARGSVLKLV
ncbi:MAG TPA: DUF192 domain-containing protein [Candidatus Binatia bacterium]|nr:DUF192 domain-containing protein [Candidatus Binatia bacterium]